MTYLFLCLTLPYRYGLDALRIIQPFYRAIAFDRTGLTDSAPQAAQLSQRGSRNAGSLPIKAVTGENDLVRTHHEQLVHTSGLRCVAS